MEKKTVQQRALEWISHGKVGISSKTIWEVMMGVVDTKKETAWHDYSYPHDPDDFSRCHALLEFIPEWRSRLHEVSAVFTDWTGLVEHWSELERLFDEEKERGRAPKLYERMRELLGDD